MFGINPYSFQNNKRTRQVLGIDAPMSLLGLKQMMSSNDNPFIEFAMESANPMASNISRGHIVDNEIDNIQLWEYNNGPITKNKFYVVVAKDYDAPSGMSVRLMTIPNAAVEEFKKYSEAISGHDYGHKVFGYTKNANRIITSGISNDEEYLSDLLNDQDEYQEIGYDGIGQTSFNIGSFVGAFVMATGCRGGHESDSKNNFMFQKYETIRYYSIDMMFIVRLMKALSTFEFSILNKNELIIAKAWFHAMSDLKQLTPNETKKIQDKYSFNPEVKYLLQSSLNEYGEEVSNAVLMSNFISIEDISPDKQINRDNALQGVPFGYSGMDDRWSLSSNDYQKLIILDMVMTEIGNGCPVFINQKHGDPMAGQPVSYGIRNDGFFTQKMIES